MKDENFYMTAKTMFGLESILADELSNLGAQNVKVMNRAVSFKGDKGFMYKANLNLRTALKILKPIAHFQAHNEKDLYEKICKINWVKVFNLENTFSTSATTHSEIFKHSKYASLIVKDAIADSFRKKFKKRPNVNAKDPDISIHLHISKKTCSISLDSSGESLHKRGYKIANINAPINEALAAGLILLSGWNKKTNFYDPMCGSGTILIEAAMIAKNIPANIFRKKFGFESWKDFDTALFEKIKETSLNKICNFNGKIIGSDNFQKNVRSSRANVTNSLLNETIKIKNLDFFESSAMNNSLVIFNPPYGERLPIEGDKFYEKIGDILKKNYAGCDVWLISSDIEKLKFIGLKPNKKIKLMNGNLECSFRKFNIYQGSFKKN